MKGLKDASPTEKPPLPSAPQETQEPPTKPQKRTVSLLGRGLRWLFGTLILFGLGALTVLFLLYIPIRQDLSDANKRAVKINDQAETDLQMANQEINRLSSLASECEDLQAELDQARLHIALLRIRLDVTTAQLALVNEEPSRARLALSKTSETMQELANLLPPDQQKIVTDMQARLELALSELKNNDDAASLDLDILVTNLLELESALLR